MKNFNLKNIVKGTADLSCIIAGGIAEYKLIDIDGHVYQLQIDMSDKKDVGETATFMAHYDKAIILMRWIRKSIEKNELIQIS